MKLSLLPTALFPTRILENRLYPFLLLHQDDESFAAIPYFKILLLILLLKTEWVHPVSNFI